MGTFITLEGPEGSGKSTVTRWLAEQLRARGEDVVVTREPGGTNLGESLRVLLLGAGSEGMPPEVEALLNSAARAQHVAEVIRPALAAGKTVISDRYLDSTLAYQGAGRGLDLAALQELQRFATGGLLPDLTLLLDVPYEVGQARRLAAGGLNRFDRDLPAFHERVRQFFLASARNQPQRWCVIDASGPLEAVQAGVYDAVLARRRRQQATAVETR